jgi:asparagine synthase (glutamine-hydrolysing)
MFCFTLSSAKQVLQSPGGIPALVPGRLCYSAPKKKIQDSFVDHRGQKTLIFEGILANAAEIITRYAAKDLQDLIWQASAKPGILAELHGQFWLALYNAEAESFQAFNNISNNCRLYYWFQDGALVVADRMRILTGVLLQSGIVPAVDPIGARMMLSYGYMLEGFSTISAVRSLPSAGQLSYAAGRMEVQRYHDWDARVLHTDHRACITEVNRLFSKAVNQAFARDEEGKHLAFLSGGLDSRMTVYAAHKAGFRKFKVLTFSEPGYLDAVIAREIADELELQYNFFSLEKGDYLQNISENLIYNDAQIILHGAAHLYKAIAPLASGDYAIIHSGQIGAIMQGNFLHGGFHSKPDISAAAYSTRILGSIIPELKGLSARYPNQELLLLHNRGFNAATNGDLACYEQSHSISPFLAPEFLQYTLNIDPSLRYGTRLFMGWIKSLYPRAARHRWEKTGAPASDPRWLVKSKYYLWRGSNKIKLKLSGKPNRLSMNPFDYWWQINPALQAQMKQEFARIEELLPLLDGELARDLQTMQNSASISEKLQAYSLARGLLYLLDPSGNRGVNT